MNFRNGGEAAGRDGRLIRREYPDGYLRQKESREYEKMYVLRTGK